MKVDIIKKIIIITIREDIINKIKIINKTYFIFLNLFNKFQKKKKKENF